MKEFANIGFIICLGLMVVIHLTYTKIETWKKESGIKYSEICENICCGLMMLSLFGVAGCSAIWISESYFSLGMIPQTIIVRDYSGDTIAKYENVNGNLTYTYSDDKLRVTADGVQHVYINTIVEIIKGPSEG